MVTLGVILGPPGVILGHLGIILGHPEVILGPPGIILGHKEVTKKYPGGTRSLSLKFQKIIIYLVKM